MNWIFNLFKLFKLIVLYIVKNIYFNYYYLLILFKDTKMPKEIKDGDMKTFLLYLRGDEKNKVNKIGKSITIKTKNRKTKFKLRCPRYVYTLKVDDEKKAEKIKTSIPKDIEKHDINEKKGKKKEQKKK